MYCVSIHELGPEIIARARQFAVNVVGETYNRFEYDFDRRIETIYIGKIAEEVFKCYAEDILGITLELNYEIYDGVENADSNDFKINDLEIDIKGSKDTKNEGIQRCLTYFNFPVPTDQHIKDITVSIIYDNKVENFCIVSWIDKEAYESNCRRGMLPVGGGAQREFYKYPLRLGRDIEELPGFLFE